VDEPAQKQPSHSPDTIIVPAQKEGFEKVFLGEDCPAFSGERFGERDFGSQGNGGWD
jgi:hypothetical protein